MRKQLVWLPLAVVAACSSGPDPEEREAEIYDRIAYLRAAYDTAYADFNTLAVDAIAQELKRTAAKEINLFGRDLQDKDSSLNRKQLAAFALAFSTDKAAQEWLQASLKSREPSVVEVALVALGMMQLEDTPVHLFRDHLNSPSARIRQAALFGLRYQLKEGKDGGALTEVTKLLEDPEMDVRNEALIVIRRMKAKEAINKIVEHCMKYSHPLVRQNAAITLAAFGADARDATPHLIETLKDEDTKVVEAAWIALNRIHGKDLDRTYQTWRDWWEEEEKRVEYICLEHAEVLESAPGQCPRSGCTQRLIRQPKPEEYICSVHPDVRLKKEGRCSACRRPLVPLRPVYVCPDHSDVRSSRPGNCTKCPKARLIERQVFVCPDHPDVEAPRAGKCSRCEKELVPRKE